MTVFRNFALGEKYDRFIGDQVEQGRFENATEVVRAGLRLLQDHEIRKDELRIKIEEADGSIATGQGKSYKKPEDLVNTIVKRGQDSLKRQRIGSNLVS